MTTILTVTLNIVSPWLQWDGTGDGDTTSFTEPAINLFQGMEVIAVDATRVLIVWSDASSVDGSARVASISGTTVTYGTEIAYTSTSGDRPAITELSSGKFLVVHRRSSNAGAAATVLEVSGTTVTAGTDVNFTGGQINSLDVVTIDSTHALTAYYSGSLGDTNTVIMTIAGTTITFNTPVLITGDVTLNHSLTLLSATRALCGYRVSGGAARMVVLSISGVTVTVNSEVDFTTDSNDASAIDSTVMSTDKVLFVYQDEDSSDDLTAMVVTVSGTVPTPNAGVVVDTGPQISINVDVDRIDDTTAILSFQNTVSQGEVMILEVAGTTPSVSVSPIIVETETPTIDWNYTTILDENNIFYGFSGDGSDGRAKVLTVL